MENKEITTTLANAATQAARGILGDMNGYVVIPLELLERLERSDSTLAAVKALAATMEDYNIMKPLKAILGIREAPEEEEACK